MSLAFARGKVHKPGSAKATSMSTAACNLYQTHIGKSGILGRDKALTFTAVQVFHPAPRHRKHHALFHLPAHTPCRIYMWVAQTGDIKAWLGCKSAEQFSTAVVVQQGLKQRREQHLGLTDSEEIEPGCHWFGIHQSANPSR